MRSPRRSSPRRGGAPHRGLLPALLLSVFVSMTVLLPPGSGSTGGSFAPPHSDAGVDTNGDGLFNYLRIGVSVHVDVAGPFTIHVVLEDDLEMGRLTEASVEVSLPAGPNIVDVLLDGTDIYYYGVDGPFYAILTLVSDIGTLLATDVHLTSAYRFADFQPFAARIVPPNSNRAIDNDTDGLSDWIDVAVTLDVATPGAYTFTSLLTDPSFVVSLRSSQLRDLPAGRVTLHQFFLGYPLRIWGINGPYMVTNTLYDSLGRVIDFLYLQTASYAAASFETPPVRLEPPHSDAGRDADGDGLFDELLVTVALRSDRADTYAVRGQLFTGGGMLLESSAANVHLGTGASSVSLAFASPAIRDSGADGPYRVDLEVYDTLQLRLGSGTHWTGPYDDLAFQPQVAYLGPSHESYGIDGNGNGKYEALRVAVQLEVTSPATIRIEAALRQGILAPDLVRASVTTGVVPGSQVVPVDFPGAAILAAGVGGPYRVWIGLYGAGSAPLEDGSSRTDAFALAEFEAAVLDRVHGPVFESPEDVDGDGLAERLRVRVSANVSEAGLYRLDGSLSRDGVPIAEATAAEYLGPGMGLADLVFAGPTLRSVGRDGPYSLRLDLRSSLGTLLASAVVSTAAHPASSFESAASVNLTGVVSSYGTGLPLAGAVVRAVDYVTAFGAETTTAADGSFRLGVFAGTYWFVVDHDDAQARVARATFLAETRIDTGLAPTARLGIHGSLTWAGWDELVMSLKYVFNADAAALRLNLDWALGDRDGFVDEAEAARLPDAPDRLRDAIDAGFSSGRITVNYVNYAAIGPIAIRDGIAGDVGLSPPPTRELFRSFTSTWRLGLPSRVSLAFEVGFDSWEVDRSLRLYIPTSYRYIACNATGDLIVKARRGALPILVDPFFPPEDGGSAGFASLSMLLYPQGVQALAPPAAPVGLTASVEGSTASLAWLRTTTATDGSRVVTLAGYRLYRAAAGGAYVRVGGLIPIESYRDAPGAGTFTYAVAAVNTDGLEGPRSAGLLVDFGDPDATGEGLAADSPPRQEGGFKPGFEAGIPAMEAAWTSFLPVAWPMGVLAVIIAWAVRMAWSRRIGSRRPRCVAGLPSTSPGTRIPRSMRTGARNQSRE